MKVRFYLAMAAAALLMSNCSQEEGLNQVQGSTKTLTATIEGASRSAVTDGGVFSWTTGDAISVYNGTGFTEFTYSGSGNAFSSEESITPSGVAIYPAGEHSYEGATATVNLKTSYNYGSTNAPMLAEVTGSTLAFKHVGGLMRFVVKGMPSDATSFTFTANARITGNFSVTTSTDGEKIITTPTNETATEESQSVSINFTQVEDVMTFYIPLPTGTYAGYTVSIGENKSHTTENTVTNTIARGTLLLMPTFTYDETEGLKKEGNNVVSIEAGEQSLAIGGNPELTIEVPETLEEGAEAVLNLNYTPTDASSTLTLSENSENTESEDESSATINVSVPNNSTVSTLSINAPSMTVELIANENESATYTEVTALTAQNTLKIGKGVSVGTLKIKGGHVKVHGQITTSIEREEGNADELTYIILEEGAELPENFTAPEGVMVVNAAEYELRKAIEAAGEYTLTSNVTLSGTLYINNTVTLNLGGYTLTNQVGNTTTDVIVVNENGNLTINGEGNVTAVTGNDGYTVISKGTLTINGGTYSSGLDADNDGNCVIYARGSGKVYINGGTFLTSEEDNTKYLVNKRDADRATATIEVKGGKFQNFDPANNSAEGANTNFVVTGYSSVLNDEGYYEVSEGILNATALVAAVAADGEVTLGANVTLSGTLYINNTVTLNLGGYTLTNQVDNTTTDVIVVNENGNLTINGEGNVTAVTGNDGYTVISKGTLTINGGTYSSGLDADNDGNCVIYARESGKVYINGGTFLTSKEDNTKYLVNKRDADRATATIEVKGGKFQSFDPANNSAEGANTNFVVAGYSSVLNDEGYYVVSKDSTEQ